MVREGQGVLELMAHVCYLAVADDEEGVSSRSLPDDVISIFIMSLKTQDRVWTVRQHHVITHVDWAGLTHLLHDISQFTQSFFWKTFESRNTVQTDRL